MDQVLSFFFGSVRRALSTCLVILVVFGMLNPEAANAAAATAWNNFWTAFGPVIQKLLELAIMGGLVFFIIRGLLKSGGGGGNKKS